MKRLVLSIAFVLSGGATMACEVGASGIAALNQTAWTVDIVHARRQWDGGIMALPEFSGEPVRTSGTKRALKLSKYAGDKPMKRRRGGVPATLAEPIGKDLRMALDATGVDWSQCATDALPIYGRVERIHANKLMRIEMIPLTQNRAAAVRWFDEIFADGVRAVSREVLVIRR